MIQLIKIYIFVLSLLYILTFLFRLIIQIKSDDINIEPMNLSVFEKLPATINWFNSFIHIALNEFVSETPFNSFFLKTPLLSSLDKKQSKFAVELIFPSPKSVSPLNFPAIYMFCP